MSEENHEDFNNLDNLELQNSDIPCYKTKSFIFILISFLVFIIAIGVFLYFFILKENENKNEYEKENGDEEDECLIYDKNKCLSCNLGYKLVDGKCIVNYSFKSEYITDYDNQTIPLIHEKYLDKINELIIDGIKINETCTKYTFNSPGTHKVFFLLNLSNMTSFDSMFSQIENMISIHFSSLFNTENITYMSSMFDGCFKLKSLDVSKFDTRKVNSTYRMFWGMTYLTSLEVSNFDTRNVYWGDDMFCYLSNITFLNLSNFNGNNMYGMDSFIRGCESLKSVDFSNFNAPKLERARELFRDCHNLEYVNLTNFNAPNLKYMTYMFLFCRSLKSIDLSSFKAENVLDMKNIFYDCHSLTCVNMNGIKFNLTSYNSEYLFNRNSNLTYIDISSWKPEDQDIIIFNEASELPLKGKIILRLDLYLIIKEQIPKGWSIIYAN